MRSGSFLRTDKAYDTYYEAGNFLEFKGYPLNCHSTKQASNGSAFLQAVFICPQITLYCLLPHLGNKWEIFFAETFPWELCPALDGLIIALFHFQLSQIGVRTSPTMLSKAVAVIPYNQTNRQS
ncbi:hypothetical protein KIN20_033427 [Parelaphostrongylus tenuis]|uniref:7TM GPCR serpentine receptor class x (Srx) domain-containing protein n=1 Tax=Parelaphostrongylus tenuis TaxID=148309 RepID=A0AAD5R832_PARTN|nr:hypothetical protein KIN20_033427 [Parelaphostrongylus tenuis]